MDRWNYLLQVQEKQHLHGSTRNGGWINAFPYCLNGMDLYREELWDNI